MGGSEPPRGSFSKSRALAECEAEPHEGALATEQDELAIFLIDPGAYRPGVRQRQDQPGCITIGCSYDQRDASDRSDYYTG